MYKIKKHLCHFSAAHRITANYKGKCRNLHGHNYSISVTLEASTLDQYGFLMDFSDIKRIFEDWIKNNIDHTTIISRDDTSLLKFVEMQNQSYYLMPEGLTSSVENLSKHLFSIFFDLLAKHNLSVDCRLYQIELWETPSSSAIITV